MIAYNDCTPCRKCKRLGTLKAIFHRNVKLKYPPKRGGVRSGTLSFFDDTNHLMEECYCQYCGDVDTYVDPVLAGDSINGHK